jgi:hypothetical protein
MHRVSFGLAWPAPITKILIDDEKREKYFPPALSKVKSRALNRADRPAAPCACAIPFLKFL